MHQDPVLNQYREHYKDIGYYVTFDLYKYRLECVAYEVRQLDDGKGTVLFTEAGDPGCGPTTELDKAEWFVSGHVKWDGCSNWTFNTEDCMAHFCERQQLINVGVLLSRLYDEAARYFPDLERKAIRNG